jgi:hypothetical protein
MQTENIDGLRAFRDTDAGPRMRTSAMKVIRALEELPSTDSGAEYTLEDLRLGREEPLSIATAESWRSQPASATTDSEAYDSLSPDSGDESS